MERGTLIRLGLLAVVAIALVVRFGMYDGRVAAPAAVRGSAGVSSGTEQELRAAAEAPPASGAPLASGVRFQDADGRERTLAEFSGTPFVASVVYTRCATVCPRVVAELQRFERETAGGAPAPRFVLFSLDPAYDTPATLTAFARAHALDPARWTLLEAPAGALPALTASLGVAMRPDAEGGIAHSAVIAIVGSDGRVLERRVGLGLAPGELAALWRAHEGRGTR